MSLENQKLYETSIEENSIGELELSITRRYWTSSQQY